MPDSELSQKYQSVYKKIIAAHRQYFIQRILEHTIKFLSFTVAMVLVFVLLNFLFTVHDAVRYVFFFGIIGWFAGYTLFRVVPLLRELFRPSVAQIYITARKMGQTDEKVLDALVNYVQIYRDQSGSGSPRIKRMALEQLYSRFSRHSFKAVFPLGNLWRSSRPFLASFGVMLLLFAIFPGPVSLAVKKIAFPWENFKEPLPLRLINRTKNVTVLKNDPVELRGSFEGVQPRKLFLVIQDSSQENGRTEKTTEKIAVSIPPGGTFDYRVPHVRNSFRYYFTAAIDQPRFRDRPAVSESGRVLVRERPMIRNLQLKITPPAYSGLPAKLLPLNDGEVTALKGSGVNIRLEADKQLSGAHIFFSDSTRLPLKISGHTAAGGFTVTKNLSYRLHIFDSDSIDNAEPVEYSVYLLSDEYPYAEIKQPGGDVDLGDDLRLPVFVEMQDDFGFSGAWLKGQVVRQGSGGDTTDFELKLDYKRIEAGKAFSEFTWDLTSFYMIPDDYIQYYARVLDNDRVSGPKSYKTAVYTVRLPSLLEIMARAEKQQNEQLKKVEDVSGQSKELKKKLEEINRELKKETEVNWERKQEIKEQLEKHKKAMKKVSEIQKELEDVVQKMDQNKMLSPETLDKYMKLQKMFEELSSPELKEAMQKLQEALEKADPAELKKQMERFQFSVEQFSQQIERTYELLKRVQLEQKMDELVNMARKMNEEQNEITDSLGEKQKSQQELDRLGKKEENLRKQAEVLEEKIGETNEDYQKMMKEFSEMLEKAKALMQEEQVSQGMQQMQQQMQSGDQEQAKQSGMDLKSRMDRLQNMLQMAQQNMMQQQKQKLAKEMQKAMKDMLASSFDQERLYKQSRELNSASAQINEVAREQSRLRESARQIIRQMVEISRKTFFLSPGMSNLMQDLLSQMQNAIRELEERNPGRAANSQMKAMAGFNQALLSMQNSMNQMMQSSSSSGFQEFMKQLQQMSGQQGQVNQQSMSLFQKGQQGRLQLSSDDMGRLAAQQEAIRKSLEQLSGKGGERRDVLGRLDELGKEMDKVVKELKRQNLDREVIRRQEKILSRLLDAQKSVREKEYSKKREAEREAQKIVKSPPELRKELLRKEDRLRRQLMEALQEGYTPEYRELIKLYFESLSRKQEVSHN